MVACGSEGEVEWAFCTAVFGAVAVAGVEYAETAAVVVGEWSVYAVAESLRVGSCVFQV